MLLLTNHIGYETQGPKQAVLLCGQTQLMDDCVLLVCARSHQTVAKLAIEWHGKVDNWHQGQFHRIDFSDFTTQATIICAWNTRILPLLRLREAY